MEELISIPLRYMVNDMSIKLFSILVNGVVIKDNKVLVSQRSWDEPHMSGKWTIPGGKVELDTEEDVFDILQKTVKREVLEETGVEIDDEMEMVVNNSFIRTGGQAVIAVVFRCRYRSGEAQALEDTIACKWVSVDEVREMEFPPNVKGYILDGLIKDSLWILVESIID